MDKRKLAWQIKVLLYELEDNHDLNSLSPLKVLDDKINTVLKLFDTALYTDYYATGIRYIDGDFYQIYFGYEKTNILSHDFIPNEQEKLYNSKKHLKTTVQKFYNGERLKHPPVKELLEVLWG